MNYAKQVTAVVIGAGMRGDIYASYSLEHPNEVKIVAFTEPDPLRRKIYAEKYQIPEEMQFSDYKDLFAREKLADCAFICTQDQMHYEPAILAMEKGYHVMCEKPMSPFAEQIIHMGETAKKNDRILTICHVLRYSPFFTRVKSFIDEGRLGKIMTIHHLEEVGFFHQAHSFVRGNWRKVEETSPMLLAKCCHDMDLIMWMTGSPCKKVSSFGERTFFKEENAPEGAALRCMDGCPHRDDCAFYAPRFYLEHPRRDGFIKAVCYEEETPKLLEALRTGPYGRCVFHCDNTAVDHQVVNMEFENGTTAVLTMSGFTNDITRKINIMGTKGQLEGNLSENRLIFHDFLTGNTETIDIFIPKSGHNGSDYGIMRDFIKLVAADGKAENKTNADVSINSHLMTLAAEQSRQTGKTVNMQEYLDQFRN